MERPGYYFALKRAICFSSSKSYTFPSGSYLSHLGLSTTIKRRGDLMDRKLRTPAAAEYLGVKPNTLEIWRHQRRGPKFYKVGRCVVYDRADLESFVQAHGVHTVDTAPKPQGRK